jgi:hypothetical protein
VPAGMPGPQQVPVDIDYLVSDDSDVDFDSFELAESTVEHKYVPSRKSRVLAKAIGLLFALAVLGFAIIGVVTVLK